MEEMEEAESARWRKPVARTMGEGAIQSSESGMLDTELDSATGARG